MPTPSEILARSRTIAVVGLSTDPTKAAHDIPRQLQAAGARIIPIHPSADLLLGERAYPSLDAVPDDIRIDLVDVFRPSQEAPGIAEAAVTRGVDALWLQLGITSPEAREIAETGGLAYVEDQCTGSLRARHGITWAD